MILQGIRVLITGATGFIGSHLAERLVAEGTEVILLIEPGASQANIASILDQVRVHEVDLRDGQMVRRLVQECRPSKVYHLAAVGVTEPGIDPRLAVQVNVMGTLNLLEALSETNCDCFVNTGTCYEYGHNTPPMHEDQMADPINAYAASKSAAWLFCNMYHRTRGYPIVTVRPFTVYGPCQSERALIPQTIISALRGEDFEMTGGEQTRDFTCVDDVVEGYIRASLSKKAIGQTINLGTGEERPIKDVVLKVLELMGSPVRPLIGALPYRPRDIRRLYSDSSKARELLGWQSQVSLEDGLRKTIAWYTEKFKAQSSNEFRTQICTDKHR
ncbi:MAG: SDR family NAD(P)-dependent oxidoreductase [Anaerolineae bacterium]|nr:SDR family NAD(P)-dependent oxidoreductase [Anaerolineae bacterium]